MKNFICYLSLLSYIALGKAQPICTLDIAEPLDSDPYGGGSNSGPNTYGINIIATLGGGNSGGSSGIIGGRDIFAGVVERKLRLRQGNDLICNSDEGCFSIGYLPVCVNPQTDDWRDGEGDSGNFDTGAFSLTDGSMGNIYTGAYTLADGRMGNLYSGPYPTGTTVATVTTATDGSTALTTTGPGSVAAAATETTQAASTQKSESRVVSTTVTSGSPGAVTQMASATPAGNNAGGNGGLRNRILVVLGAGVGILL